VESAGARGVEAEPASANTMLQKIVFCSTQKRFFPVNFDGSYAMSAHKTMTIRIKIILF
jgi:hypothetical protein